MPSRLAPRTILLAAATWMLLAPGCDQAVPPAAAPPTPPPGGAAAPQAGPTGPLAEAMADARQGKFDEGLARARGVLKDKPKDRQALFVVARIAEAQAAAHSKDLAARLPAALAAADAARALNAAYAPLGPAESAIVRESLYGSACALALAGRGDEAMTALVEAFDAGYSDLAVFENDPELQPLRARPDYAEFLRSLDGRVLARLSEGFRPFPFALDLVALDGAPLTLAESKGKVVIVDLWGTWCPPCVKEVPFLASLYAKYHARGLDIVGVNCLEEANLPPPGTLGAAPHADRSKEAVEGVRAFLQARQVPYRCGLSDGSVEARVPDLKGFPTTLFLDRSGRVRLKLEGFDPADTGQIERAVKALLDEK